MPAQKIIILGAGFQGVCAALGLQHQGYSVTLVDKAPDCMLRASLRNEGKIHIGFVYANDASFKTSSLMLESSLSFARSIEEWLGGPLDWSGLKSRPFIYVILRDSLLSAEKILASYEKLQDRYTEMVGGASANYLGDSPHRLWQEVSPTALDNSINEDYAVKFIKTPEVALDLVKFRHLVRSKLNHARRVERLYDHEIKSIERASAGFRVEGEAADGSPWKREADAVVNCLWEGRLKLDQQMGLMPRRDWVYRLKYRLLGHLPQTLAGLPSLTLVLGPFGDVVVKHSGEVYISWYPSCMRGWCTDLVIPQRWESACNGEVDARVAGVIAQEALDEFDRIIPGLGQSRINTVDAGIIFSWGKSDISDLKSELHERYNIGVQADDGYFSVNTGKFTCAPFFAQQLIRKLR